MEHFTYFILILPIVSFLYSSVGHGGASGYLALMALFSFPNELMKQTSLILNLFVAGIAFYQYYKGGHFKFLTIAFKNKALPNLFSILVVKVVSNMGKPSIFLPKNLWSIGIT